MSQSFIRFQYLQRLDSNPWTESYEFMALPLCYHRWVKNSNKSKLKYLLDKNSLDIEKNKLKLKIIFDGDVDEKLTLCIFLIIINQL